MAEQTSILTKMRAQTGKKGKRISDVINIGDVFTIHADMPKAGTYETRESCEDIRNAILAKKAIQIMLFPLAHSEGLAIQRIDLNVGSIADGYLDGFSVAVEPGGIFAVTTVEVDFTADYPVVTTTIDKFELTPAE